MNKRVVPKVSGLVKVGSLTAAPEEEVQSLPDIPAESGNSAASKAQAAEASKSSAPATPEPKPALAVPAPVAAPRIQAPSPAPSLDTPETSADRWLLIPLAKLRIHPFNSRTVRTQERIEEVCKMLEDEHIQREPITVVPGRKPEDKGFFFILSGQTRYHAANLAGWKALKSQINEDIDPDDHLAFWAASLEHNSSVKETDWDIALKAKQLLDEKKTLEEVQRAARRDPRALRRILGMMDLPDSVIAIIKENPGKLSAVFCEPLKSGLEDLGEDAIAAIARMVVEKNMSKEKLIDHIEREIRRKRNQAAGSARRAKREFMLPITVGNNKKEAGALKIMQSPKAEGNRLVTLTADIPESLVEIFKADMVAAIEKLTK